MSDPDTTGPVAPLAEVDPDALREQAIENGLIDEETSPEDVGIVAITENPNADKFSEEDLREVKES